METKEYLIINGPNKLGLMNALFMRTSKNDDPRFKIREKDGDGTKCFELHTRILSVTTMDGYEKWGIGGFAYYLPKNPKSEMVKVRFDFKGEYSTYKREGFLTVLRVHNQNS